MNEWNNYETLEHHEGLIWVSKSFATESKGNICLLVNDEFQVLAYISPEKFENNDLTTVVEEVVKANGAPYMLENEMIMCSICNKNYNEADVNIVDYAGDVCIICEKDYAV